VIVVEQRTGIHAGSLGRTPYARCKGPRSPPVVVAGWSGSADIDEARLYDFPILALRALNATTHGGASSGAEPPMLRLQPGV